MARRRIPWYPYEFDECDWCRRKIFWRTRPCLSRGPGWYTGGGRAEKRERHEQVRMKNAAWREYKTMPRARRREAKIAAAAAAAQGGGDESPGQIHLFKHDDKRTPAKENKNSETEAENTTLSDDSLTTQADPAPTQSKRDTETFEVTKTQQQRQSKASSAHKDAIHEGLSLAFDDDDDVARILAANRRAWPRGQAPIALDATTEDKDVAELIRIGLLDREGLAVNHWEDEMAGQDFSPYTVRVRDARKMKGRRQNSWSLQGRLQDSDAESDWWYLDDEALDQLLSDGGFDLIDGSEASFVYVE